jgi:hypothetical protein
LAARTSLIIARRQRLLFNTCYYSYNTLIEISAIICT